MIRRVLWVSNDEGVTRRLSVEEVQDFADTTVVMLEEVQNLAKCVEDLIARGTNKSGHLKSKETCGKKPWMYSRLGMTTVEKE